MISIHALRGEGDESIGARLETRPSFQSTPSVGRATFPQPACRSNHSYFNPRPPWGGRLSPVAVGRNLFYFNPRPPWGGRPRHISFRHQAENFNPRPPWGGRRMPRTAARWLKIFQSTPSVGRATYGFALRRGNRCISIHALRGEGDKIMPKTTILDLIFQSTPSVGRATMPKSAANCWQILFQSTPSVGRATIWLKQARRLMRYFNPRPPWGGRLGLPRRATVNARFQSTPSVGRATATCALPDAETVGNFNPRPPWGGRRPKTCAVSLSRHFNPRPPWGGRRRSHTKNSR